ncbi:MAG: aspartate carbamoyltransferase [Bdellovibrionales bacterium]
MPKSLIEFRDWSSNELQKLIQNSFYLEKNKGVLNFESKPVVALLFFESSTRTRISFEIACHRENYSSVLLSGKSGSSLDKGETLQDTIENIVAMKPDLLVVRSDHQLNQAEWAQRLNIPFISAGWGSMAHPTQALLDVRTLMKKGRDLSKTKLVIIGDIQHSRVAQSHFQLSEKLGYDLAVLPHNQIQVPRHVRCLSNFDEALSWSNVIMALRYQVERHQEKMENEEMKKWQINSQILQNWKEDGLLLHPGPVNYGYEMAIDAKSSEKYLLMDQVESGVWVRRACMNYFLRGAM